MNLVKDNLKNFILSIISSFALCLLIESEIGNVFVFGTFFLSFFFIYKKIEIKISPLVTILSFILSVLLTIGKYPVYLSTSSGLLLYIRMCVTIIGSYVFFSRLLQILFIKLNSFECRHNFNVSNKKIFFISLAIIITFWIPVLIAEYPGIITNDFLNQIYQGKGIIKYSNLNPLLYTIYIKILIDFFSLFINDINLCVFVITIIQVLINSCIFAYSVVYIKQRTNNKYLVICSLIFYSLISYNAIYGITLCKDSAYAGFAILFLIEIDKYCQNSNIMNAISLILTGILYCLLRSNGYFSFIITFVLMIVVSFKKNFKKTLFVLLVVFIISSIIKYPVYNTFIALSNPSEKKADNNSINNKKYAFRNSFMYVIPFQQIANVVTHGRELNEKEEWLIEEYIPLEKIPEVYNPILVDPLYSYAANHVKDSRANIDDIEYLKLWVELFIKYPSDFLEAYVNMNRYYYYPARYVNMYYTGVVDNKIGLEKRNIISADYTNFIEKVYTSEKDVPFISVIFSPGVIVYILLIAIFYCIYKSNYSSLVCLFPCLGNLLILMFFVPLNDEFRYVYPIVVCFPLIIAQFFNTNYEVQEKNVI